MATRVQASVNASGGTDLTIRPVTPEEQKRLDALMAGEDVEASPGRRLFRKTEEVERKPVYERVEIDGIAMYARAFDYKAYLLFNMIAKRDKLGRLDVSTEENQGALVVALAYAGIVNSPENPTPFFARDELFDAIDSTDPRDHQKLATLTGHVVVKNPHLFPHAKEKIREQAEIIAEAKKNEVAAQSTMPPKPSPENGSTAAASTEKLPTSPGDSMEQTESTATTAAT